jgi:hypothetical protein
MCEKRWEGLSSAGSSSVAAKRCRASLDRTAGGRCPHMCIGWPVGFACLPLRGHWLASEGMPHYGPSLTAVPVDNELFVGELFVGFVGSGEFE